jgi:hypothetical protein
MTRRNRRPSPPSSSDEDQAPQPIGQALVLAPSANSVQEPGSDQPTPADSRRELDSALQALADRIDDLSDPDEPVYQPGQNEVVENYVSDAGLGKGGLPLTETPAPAAEDLECIVTAFTQAYVNTAESKFSNVSAISARDTHLMQEKREEIEAHHASIVERYKALQRQVDLGLQEMMGQTPHVSQILSDIRPSATGDFPSIAEGSSSSAQEKNTGASEASADGNGNSVFPPQEVAEFTQSAAQAQGGSHVGEGAGKAGSADTPKSTPAARTRFILADAAVKILWQTSGPTTLEVFPPLEEKSELVKDMIAELKQAAKAAFADCDELPQGKALLALEASRYLEEASGWPSIP